MRTGCHYLICLCVRVCSIRCFYLLRELLEADFHKPGIYGSGRVWANAWDVFRLAPSRVGRSRRAAVAFVACFRSGGIFFFFQVNHIFFSNACTSTRPMAARDPDSSQRRLGEALRQSANLPTDNSRPHFPTKYTVCLLYTSPSPRD